MDTSVINQSEPSKSDCRIIADIHPIADGLSLFETILNEASIPYVKRGGFLLAGKHGVSPYDWVLHLTVIPQQVVSLLKLILPVLRNLNVNFSVPENSLVHSLILDGGMGYNQIGKVVAIYPNNKTTAVILANQLITLAKTFSGPVIPAAYPLGGILYTEFIENEFANPLTSKNDWPFKSLNKQNQQKNKRWIKKYLIVDQLKSDAKGKVLKCLNLTNLLNIQWCVVKQGLAYQCVDNFGRTIKDRLKWQFEVLEYYKDSISLPKAIGYFEQDNDAYLVTEFINGQSLNTIIELLHQGTYWPAMPVDAKRKLLKYLIEITDLIGRFHDCGLVHRDINPGNFMIREDESLVAIDVELAYDLCAEEPRPPFNYGTPGYISLQQQQMQLPSNEDDIYGLGALILKVITGISPGKFSSASDDELFKNLEFFISNTTFAAIIISCLKDERTLRPELKSIGRTLQVYDVLLLTNAKKMINYKGHNLELDTVKASVQRGINYFLNAVYLNKEGFWLSKISLSQTNISNEIRRYEWEAGLANGVSGMIYLLSVAELNGFDIVELHHPIILNYNSILENIKGKGHHDGSLFSGSAGIGICINAMMASGVIENSIHNHDRIYKSLNAPVHNLNIADGLAGQGLAMLACSENLLLPSFYEQLSIIADKLIKEQNRDGSWTLKKNAIQNKGIKLYGFADGIAGILYFLLAFTSKYEDQKAKQAIIKSLDWLLKQRKVLDGNLIWSISPINKSIDPWLESGFSGIALTFIKAFEIFDDLQYKDAATTALLCHPKYISSNYLSLGNGISGLGEIYLEAYKIFKEDEWKERADHIANLLIHCSVRQNNTSTYWLDGNETQPDGTLLSGNSGILHFLIRNLYPDKVRLFFN